MLSITKCLHLLQTVRFTNNTCSISQRISQFCSLSQLPNKLPINKGNKQNNYLWWNQNILKTIYNSQGTHLYLPLAQYKTASKMDTKTEKTTEPEEKEPTQINASEKLQDTSPTSYKEKLKQAMAQYGSTVIIFHITISLMSLGICYMAVSSGLDLSAILEKFGLSENSMNKLASSSGTFAAAYLIHKVFAPVRLSITLTCTPFIVRYLRKAGIIKKALPKVGSKSKKN